MDLSINWKTMCYLRDSSGAMIRDLNELSATFANDKVIKDSDGGVQAIAANALKVKDLMGAAIKRYKLTASADPQVIIQQLRKLMDAVKAFVESDL